ncbi:MAG: Tex-like N-terminal domain-containing protein [Bdellovibrionales bacterium]
MNLSFEQYFALNASEIKFTSATVVLALVAEGGTVPFIARYRKEKTGNLDEVAIRKVIELHETYEEIIKRKAFILKEIDAQGNLTGEIKTRIQQSYDLGELEEIYRPFKKKKKTKATIARDAGLEPLADWIWALGHGTIKDSMTLEVKAKEFVNAAAKFVTYEEVLKGATDIIVEKIANEEALRTQVRDHLFKDGKVTSKRTKNFKPKSKYSNYEDYSEEVSSLVKEKSSHRYLAIRRGWQESELAVSISGDQESLEAKYIAYACSVEGSHAGAFLKLAAKTALNVYVLPSISNEIHRKLKDEADGHAILVFAENVRKLLLSSPYGAKCVLGVDPGLRTGCKLALVDKAGHFLSHTVLHVQGESSAAKAKKLFSELFKQVELQAIAVGNGTGGREAEAFFRKIISESENPNVPVVLVNEAGASIYSASDVAREEFPELDLTVRGAISIARRLQDPLAELVKIDPKSIGVGQYQHDVNQTKLKKNLDSVVESCVNSVGVDVNTASVSLLSYVAGVGPALAQNIVEYRKDSGLFGDRGSLLKVKRFSDKVFEQSAGFLRIPNSENPLDNTGIHPESYSAVKDMVKDLGAKVSEVIGKKPEELLKARTKWVEVVGEYTFDDIVAELEKTGRDPRGEFEVFKFRDDIHQVSDLEENMICPGLVTNVTNFGAFVDIGVHQDGLVHISHLSHKFVDDPRKVVSPGDKVKVKVLGIDGDKNQISLSMLLEERVQPQKKSSGKKSSTPRRGKKPSSNPTRAKGGARKPASRPKPAFNNAFSGLADLKGQLKK